MKFKVTLDKTTKIISGAILVLPLALFLFKHETIWVTLLLEALFFGCFALAPLSYKLTEKELIVNRLFKSPHFPLAEIKNVTTVPDAKAMRWKTVRTFGSGGFFGYFGKFWNKELGNMTWYLTNFETVLLVELTSGRKILLSPDDDTLRIKLKEKINTGQPVSV